MQPVSHPNEAMLRAAYAAFARGEFDGFLEHCTDDVTFVVPGSLPLSRTYTKATFMDLVGFVGSVAGTTFREDIVECVANDDHGVLVLDHSFERDGRPVGYRTDHLVTLRGGKIASWLERPGSLPEFEAAWG
jgi:ketosteroid isomerase-like protein